MSRPSRALDRKLLDAARRMLPESGLSNLSIRDVARRAGVNLGMFHYHFKCKESFIDRLLQETYEDFFSSFRDAAEAPGSPIERLRRVLISFARYVRERRGFYALLAREALNGQKQCLGFIARNFPRHAAILIGLLRECRSARLVRPLPVPVLAAFAMAGMGIPNVLMATLEKNRLRSVFAVPMARFSRMMLSDTTIEARADMVMAGLSSPPRKAA